MRIDRYMVEQSLVKTRSQATDLIRRGLVLCDDQIVTKPGFDVKGDEEIVITEPPKYVSRGGIKLEDAITTYQVDFKDKTVMDIGASTGGFTDCALQHGACLVYTYDVGTDQLDPILKQDPRIIVHEGTNILDVDIPTVDIILIDVSFTSILPIFDHVKDHKGWIIALIKPQFEAGPIHMKHGVLKDEKMQQSILTSIESHVSSLGFDLIGIKPSMLKGKTGNQEYLMVLKKNTSSNAIMK